ncbi:hypothetical protein [Micromonospora sp. NPDC023633]|uniref:hypothetical protein n=1 Tax=Micromonospora sp. NPDC023633 TaxID=3154320 RepID=UPI0033EA9479
MTTITRRGLAAVGLAAALLAPAVPAAAAPTTTGRAVAEVGRLVLEPSARGYQGTLPITVTNDTAQPVSHVLVTEPVAGSWRGTLSNEFCTVVVPKQFVRTYDCAVPVAAGQSYTFSARFEVLTRTRPYPMSTRDGQVAVQVGYDAPVTTVTPFRTLFRSTSGSLAGARPYRQDRTADASLTVGEARLTRQEDGRWAGWLPVTIRYGGDAPHNDLYVAASLPNGMDIPGTDPASEVPTFAGGFLVPGGEFMAGEQRVVRVRLTAPADADPGVLGTGTFALEVVYEGGPVDDRLPADNAVSFPVTLLDGV